MKNYSFFDYEKVWSILTRFKFVLETKSDYYRLEVVDFEDAISYQFEVYEDFFEEDAINDVNNYNLIECRFYIGNAPSPIFIFLMGESTCKINFFLRLNGSLKKNFHEISSDAGDMEDGSWRKVLNSFFEKINLSMEKEIQININPSLPTPGMN